MRPITIVDVAEKARVSVSTVSRVLKEEPNVSPEVRQRVKAIIEKLGYTPSMAARRMGGSKSYLIISFNDRRLTIENWRSGRGNDWLDQMLHGAMLACEKAGYHFMFELIDIEADGIEQQITKLIGSLRPDGVILTPPISDDETVLSALRRRKVPMVRLGAHSGGPGRRVYMDDDAAAKCVTNYLLELGHKRIGFIAGSYRFMSSQQRVETFHKVMKAAGAPVQEAWVQKGDFTYQSGVTAAEALLRLDSRPTAIQASNDEMALGALHAAQRLGVSVPEQLSIVSYDDTPAMLYCNPPLTAVRHPTAAMAARAAELLLDANAANEKSDIVVPFEFVHRGSCAAPGEQRGEDVQAARAR